jgi:hypothetical protein
VGALALPKDRDFAVRWVNPTIALEHEDDVRAVERARRRATPSRSPGSRVSPNDPGPVFRRAPG